MNYQEFLQQIQTKITATLAPGTTLQVQTITKNNGVFYDAFIIVSPGINISPTIYIPPYYHRYLDGLSIDMICEDIITTYKEHLPATNFDTTIFTDYTKAKSKIVMRLVNYERNKNLLQQVPHKRFLDFAIIFYCLLQANEKQQANILIYHHHLNYWNVTTDELYEQALCNTPLLLPHHLENLHTILEEILGQTKDSFSPSNLPMYVLSNFYRTNGATTILYPNLLSRIADSFEQNLVILPSSVHEILIIPTDESEDLEHYSHMVREVNETQLADDEVLSDHAYFYSRETRLLTGIRQLQTDITI